MKTSAVISDCGKYRYSLGRIWGDLEAPDSKGYAMFIGLNPSTADATLDDPTIRRCVGFAKDWGYDGLQMANLFAFRATDPKVMLKAVDPIGPDNDLALTTLAMGSAVVVAAWGTHGVYMGRDIQVKEMFPNLHYLKLTVAGHPSHPLYLPKTLTPIPYHAQVSTMP